MVLRKFNAFCYPNENVNETDVKFNIKFVVLLYTYTFVCITVFTLSWRTVLKENKLIKAHEPIIFQIVYREEILGRVCM